MDIFQTGSPITYSKPLQRIASLVLLIALYVMFGGWFFFKGERDRILQNTEIRLWAEARATVNMIAIWYAPIHQQGELFAASDITKLYMTSVATPGMMSKYYITSSFHEESYNQSMNIYLQNFANRIQAKQAVLVDTSGKIVASSSSRENEITLSSIDNNFDKQLLQEKLTEGVHFLMPMRMTESVVFFDTVFPVYATGSADGSSPLVGGVVATFDVTDRLKDWLEDKNAQLIRSILLESNQNAVSNVSSTGITTWPWQKDNMLPGGQHPINTSADEGNALTFKSMFWRITNYLSPVDNGYEAESVYAVAMQVPQIESWFVVKETPALQIENSINALLFKTLSATLAAGALLLSMLTARWWWLDGRTHRDMRKALTKTQEYLYNIQQVNEFTTSKGEEAVCAMDTKGVVIYVNKIFVNKLAISIGDIVGKNIYELLKTSKLYLHKDADAKLLNGETVEPFADVWFEGEIKRQLNYLVYKNLLFSRSGEVQGIITLFLPNSIE